MVTTSVTYPEGSEERLVAHREVVGVTHKGSDQAPLHGRRAGRGVRSQQAHDAQGPEHALGDGCAFALHAGSGGRVLPAARWDEALALIASYEALLRYPVHPFSTKGLSAVTKLRAALPKDVVAQLDRLRRHVFVGGPVRDYEAPLLGELLSAALEAAHLKVTYDSIESGVTERVIFPYGLYASQGYWYCVCFDSRREMNVP